MPGSARRAGYATTVLGLLFGALDVDMQIVYDAIAEFGRTDPALWNEGDGPERAFFDRYTALLRDRRPDETHAAHVLRVLSVERLRGTENPAGLSVLPWTLAAALGRVSEADPLASSDVTGPQALLFPHVTTETQTISFTASDTLQTRLRPYVGGNDRLIGDDVLTARPPASVLGGTIVGGGSRFSPFGRAGSTPSLRTPLVQPVPTDADWVMTGPAGETCAVLSGPYDLEVVRRVSSVVRRPNGGYRLVRRPDPEDTRALSSNLLPRVLTPTDARLRGEPTMRVPGDAVPSPRWLGLSERPARLQWGDAASGEGGSVPLDLDDASVRFDSPTAYTGTAYGGGTPATITRQDHPLASDF